jgi:hypothetical protein
MNYSDQPQLISSALYPRRTMILTWTGGIYAVEDLTLAWWSEMRQISFLCINLISLTY